MNPFNQYEVVQQFEQYLGNPNNPEHTFSYKAILEFDETEQYPEPLFDVINRWGYQKYHIPSAYGGELTSLEQLFALARSVSRRDLTVAIANGVCFLGSIPIWLVGTDEQRKHAATLLSANHKFGFALSEKEHGHDILANKLEAVPNGGQYIINGSKWTVGHATRSDALSLYARTSPAGGPRGHSMLFIDKSKLESATFSHLPKIRTLGLRSHDLSGISFHDCPINKESLIGNEGDGLLLATKSTLITRSLCSALMLGAADTALRTTVQFSMSRILYGKSLFEIENARAIMADAYIDILICDCLATMTMRGWHFVTDQMSVWAPAVKYMVPSILESSIHKLVSVFGSRFFLREDPAYGIFQKIYRDVPIVSVFEGGSHSQLHGVALQMKQLLFKQQTDHQLIQETMKRTFSLNESIETFIDPDRIELHSHGANYALQGLEYALMHHHREIDCEAATQIETLVAALLHQYEELKSEFKDAYPSLRDKSVNQLKYAQRYFALHTAAVCYLTWIYNRDHMDVFFKQGHWLIYALRRLLFNETLNCSQAIDLIGSELTNRLHNHLSYSIVPIALPTN